MSQRQDKYIAQLLKANSDRVLATYRELRALGYWGAQGAMRAARRRVLLELAQEANLLHFEFEVDNCMDIDDWGDFQSEREAKRITERYNAGKLVPYSVVAYVRDRDGDWDDIDALGGIWVDDKSEQEDQVDGASQLEVDDQVAEALYRHRARDDFGEFTQRWVPGHYTVE